MTVPDAAPAWKVWTALGIVYVVWGSTYLAIRYVVESVPPLLSAGARFATAGLLLASYLLVRRGHRALAVTRKQYVNAAVVGLLLLLGGNGGVTIAEERGLPSGLTALIIASVPLFVVLLRMLDHDRPALGTMIGVGIGFVGLAVLLRPGARPEDVSAGSALIVLLSSLLWALGSYYASRADMPAEPLVASVAEMAAGAIGLGVAGALTGESVDVGEVQLSSVVGLVYLVLFGSIVAFTAYSWLLQSAPVSKVSTYAYVNPVVAVFLGALFVDEVVTGTSVVGGAITLLAVAVVVSTEGRRRRAEPVVVPADAPTQTPDDVQGRDRRSAT